MMIPFWSTGIRNQWKIWNDMISYVFERPLKAGERLGQAHFWLNVYIHLSMEGGILDFSNPLKSVPAQSHTPRLQNGLSSSKKFPKLTSIYWVSLTSHLPHWLQSSGTALQPPSEAAHSKWAPHRQSGNLVWQLTLGNPRAFTHSKDSGIWINMAATAPCEMKG